MTDDDRKFAEVLLAFDEFTPEKIRQVREILTDGISDTWYFFCGSDNSADLIFGRVVDSLGKLLGVAEAEKYMEAVWEEYRKAKNIDPEDWNLFLHGQGEEREVLRRRLTTCHDRGSDELFSE